MNIVEIAKMLNKYVENYLLFRNPWIINDNNN